jgi:hypothetical protein
MRSWGARKRNLARSARVFFNRLDSGVSLGAIVHFNNNNSIWIQESYNKVVTVPWYTTSSIGSTYSW